MWSIHFQGNRNKDCTKHRDVVALFLNLIQAITAEILGFFVHHFQKNWHKVFGDHDHITEDKVSSITFNWKNVHAKKKTLVS